MVEIREAVLFGSKERKGEAGEASREEKREKQERGHTVIGRTLFTFGAHHSESVGEERLSTFPHLSRKYYVSCIGTRAKKAWRCKGWCAPPPAFGRALYLATILLEFFIPPSDSAFFFLSESVTLRICRVCLRAKRWEIEILFIVLHAFYFLGRFEHP